ncbi:MAG: phosphopantetheine-binding protein [Pseudomonadota bacterium]
MTEKTPAEKKMAQLIVDALNLEDITADEIGPEEQLFGDEIGLDSIDALEIAMAIAKEYGVQLKAEDENTRAVFRDIKSLSAYVEANRQAA